MSLSKALIPQPLRAVCTSVKPSDLSAASTPCCLSANHENTHMQGLGEKHHRSGFVEVDRLFVHENQKCLTNTENSSLTTRTKDGIINSTLLYSIIFNAITTHTHTQKFLQPAIANQGWNYLIIWTPPRADHLKVIIGNDLPVTDLFLPDDQTRSHLRSISCHIHYDPTRLHSSLPAPPVHHALLLHSSPTDRAPSLSW